MNAREMLQDLKRRVEANLNGIIMPFWEERMLDEQYGGFFGKVSGDLRPDVNSPKSLVLNARLLWYYARQYDRTKRAVYHGLANRAYDYVREHFVDKRYGGAYWLVNASGDPLEIEKRTYAQAFLIYCMAEYDRVFGCEEAGRIAMETFVLVESRATCPEGGYYDALARDWAIDTFLRRWAMNAAGTPKTLNSQMHLFEAYTAFLHVREDAALRAAVRKLLEYFVNDAFDWEAGHFKAGMDEGSRRLDDDVSFGHDSECSYIISDAAALIGEPLLLDRARELTRLVMGNVVREGLDTVNGGMYYEKYMTDGRINKCKVWWTQAESMTGLMDAYQRLGDERFLDAVINVWDYVEENMVDRVNGEWLALGENKVLSDEDRRLEALISARVGDPFVKASRTKCPYHDGKACMELIDRCAALLHS